MGLLAALLAAVLLVEFGFRGLVAAGVVEAEVWPLVDVDVENSLHRYSDDPELVYECRPGTSRVVDGIAIRINSAGFRGPEFPGDRTDGVRRVAVIGDSVTFAADTEEEKRFTALLPGRLEAATGERWEVLEFGVTGYNSLQELRLLDTRVLEHRPDLVVVAYVMNDIGPTDGLGELCLSAHPSRLAARLRSHLMIHVLDRMDRRSAWGRRSFDLPARLFARLAELGGSGGPRALVAFFPQLMEDRATWNRPLEYDRAMGLARESGLPRLDLRDGWADRAPADRGELFLDRTHLSPAGHADVADRLASAVVDALR